MECKRDRREIGKADARKALQRTQPCYLKAFSTGWDKMSHLNALPDEEGG